jgi:cation transporter-like permease
MSSQKPSIRKLLPVFRVAAMFAAIGILFAAAGAGVLADVFNGGWGLTAVCIIIAVASLSLCGYFCWVAWYVRNRKT